MKKINLKKYNSFIFDFDGVILDSNNIKKNAISEAVFDVLSSKMTEEFVNYFVNLNGVPREVKIAKYFSDDRYEYVLNRYEEIISKKLKQAKLIPGVENFIKRLFETGKSVIVLSGGTQGEVLNLLTERGLVNYFDGVYGGPSNKEENLKELSLSKPVLYFGDSEVDYLVSKNNDFDFVFVYGASNIEDWEGKVKNWQLVKSMNNFNDEGEK